MNPNKQLVTLLYSLVLPSCRVFFWARFARKGENLFCHSNGCCHEEQDKKQIAVVIPAKSFNPSSGEINLRLRSLLLSNLTKADPP